MTTNALLVRCFLADYSRNGPNLVLLAVIPVVFVVVAAPPMADAARLLGGTGGGPAVETVTAGWAAAFLTAVAMYFQISSARTTDRRLALAGLARVRLATARLTAGAVLLADLMRLKPNAVAVGGTHGKTTTTSLTGLVISEGDFDPTIIVGGKVSVFGSNAVSGEGDIIIIEADEYDRTFLRLTPIVAVITNIEAEHLDIYADLDDIKDAFTQYANKVPFFGRVIACLDDANVQDILGNIDRPVVTYGTARQANIRADEIRKDGMEQYFGVWHNDTFLGEINLHVPGIHNVRNALAAIAVGLEMEMPFESIASGLDKFTGVQRRFQLKGVENDIYVIDDYAHHPTEVKATLKAANEGWRTKRIVAVFQPHLYSRTEDFKEEFARAFFNADLLVITDVFPSREAPRPGITGALIADLAKHYGHRHVHYVEDKKELPHYLKELTQSGDVVITMGAGDIWRYGEAFLQLISNGEDNGTGSA